MIFTQKRKISPKIMWYFRVKNRLAKWYYFQRRWYFYKSGDIFKSLNPRYHFFSEKWWYLLDLLQNITFSSKGVIFLKSRWYLFKKKVISSKKKVISWWYLYFRLKVSLKSQKIWSDFCFSCCDSETTRLSFGMKRLSF